MDTDHSLLGKRVAFVGAHPDDESFTCGGTLCAIARSGGSVDLLVATSGERGRAYVDRALSDADLVAMRRAELAAVAQRIGARNLTLLAYPDGALREHVDGFETAITAQLALWDPELVIGFGADGYTGHADHIAAGIAARRAAATLGIPYVAVSLPETYREEFRTHLHGKRKHGIYEDVDDDDHVFRVDIDPEDKMALLRTYHSQFDGLDPYAIFPADLADHFLAHEYFAHHHAA